MGSNCGRQPLARRHLPRTTSGYEVGVPQCYILGPILFSLYINDLPSVCKGCYIQTYADDTVIYVHAKNKGCT